MPVAGSLKKQAEEQNITVKELCERAVAEHGSEFKAAMSLGVYPNTIRWHISKPDTEDEKRQEPEHAA